MWAHLGMGYSMKNMNGNFAPYLQTRAIDPAWLQAIGSTVPDPNYVAPIGLWRPHELPEEEKVTPKEEEKGPLVAEVTEKVDDFPGQSDPAY